MNSGQISPRRLIVIAIICVAAVAVYTVVIFRLRSIFDDRWPYINVFLVSPGDAAVNACIIAGLIISVMRYKGFPKFYSRMITGFSLLLVGGLLHSLFIAWTAQHRHELQRIVFDVPWRNFVWTWYSRLEVPRLVAAVGFAFLVSGVAKACDHRSGAVAALSN